MGEISPRVVFIFLMMLLKAIHKIFTHNQNDVKEEDKVWIRRKSWKKHNNSVLCVYFIIIILRRLLKCLLCRACVWIKAKGIQKAEWSI